MTKWFQMPRRSSRSPGRHREGQRLYVECLEERFLLSSTITEYNTTTAASQPFGITAGPNGALWFTENASNKIGRVTTAGIFTEYTIPTSGSKPNDITTGPDGALWFTERNSNKIGRVTTAGVFTEYSVLINAPSVGLQGIVTGPDGALWFTEAETSTIGRITTAGVITTYTLPSSGSSPQEIAVGSDGALWFTETGSSKIGRITTSGAITQYIIPTASSQPRGIAAGPDGALWFTERASNKIGRVTTSGVFTEYALGSGSAPYQITTGSDGALWFTEYGTSNIGRLTTAGVLSQTATPTAGSLPLEIASGPDNRIWFTENNSARIGAASGPTGTSVTTSVSPAVYGQSVTFTATLSWGSVGTPTGTVTFADGATTLGTGTINSSGVATFSTAAFTLSVGSHSITTVYSGDTNFYASTSPALAETVNPAATTTILASATNPSTYGQSVTFTATVNATLPGTGTPTGTITFEDGGTPLSTGSVSGGAATFSISTLTTGSHTITAVYGGTGNYSGSTSAGQLQTVNQAALTVTANGATKVYGQTNPSFGVSYSGFVNGESSSSLGGTLSFTTSCTVASHVGAYAITPGGLTSSNYAINFVASSLSVTPAALTVSTDGKSKVYGAALPGLSASYSGFVNADTAASLISPVSLSTTATLSSHVGSYSITAAGAADPDYTITYQGGTLSVTPASLTISADGKSKVYGAALPGLSASYGGFVNADTAASLISPVSLSTTATLSSHVGSYSITAAGAVDPDYTISYQGGTLSVTPASLTISADGKSKVYGAALPGLSASYGGFVNGDSSASLSALPTLSTTAGAGSHVGSYTITAAGAVDPDYTISYQGGTLSVTPASLTISADGKSKVYGAALPGLSASYGGFVNADTAASLISPVSLSTTATLSSHVGSYSITAAGAVDPDYTISYQGGTLSVTPASLTISADGKSKVYGAALPGLSASYSGFVNADTAASLISPVSLSTTATLSSHVGSYSITAAGAVDPDYTITYQGGTLSVTPASLTISADGKSKVYGAALPGLSASYGGFVNADTAASLISPVSLSTTATLSSHVGSYSITAAGAVDPDYTISYQGGTLSVTPASLTISADGKSKVYGAALPTLTASYGGFVNGDSSASLSALPTLSTTAGAGSHAGTYAITVSGAVDPDYAITYQGGTLIVTRACLSCAARNKIKAYGAVMPVLTAVFSGFVNGDTEASLITPVSLSTTASGDSHVGAYDIFAMGAASPDYIISYELGTLTITPARLLVTVADTSRQVGQNNPNFFVAYVGLVNGDTPDALHGRLRFYTSAGPLSPAGDYPVRADGLYSTDYTIAYTDGLLTVVEQTVTVAIDSGSKEKATIAFDMTAGKLETIPSLTHHRSGISAASLPPADSGNLQRLDPSGNAQPAFFPAEIVQGVSQSSSITGPVSAASITGVVELDGESLASGLCPAPWTVLLERQTGDEFVESGRVETDLLGRYLFSQVPNGNYRLRIVPKLEGGVVDPERTPPVIVHRAGVVIERNLKPPTASGEPGVPRAKPVISPTAPTRKEPAASSSEGEDSQFTPNDQTDAFRTDKPLDAPWPIEEAVPFERTDGVRHIDSRTEDGQWETSLDRVPAWLAAVFLSGGLTINLNRT